MAEMYARATRVVVWLGKDVQGGGNALEAIRAAAVRRAFGERPARRDKEAVRLLLERPWSERIWEVAAARNVVMRCGSIGIDGSAFCSGLKSLSEGAAESYSVHHIPTSSTKPAPGRGQEQSRRNRTGSLARHTFSRRAANMSTRTKTCRRAKKQTHGDAVIERAKRRGLETEVQRLPRLRA
ncbi:hypothetical protein B0H67DRAFT_499583 [Lasiosphaeris hirsuta]|uniref:Uncharacterized protein n=1 Tax=Lasiosphaeris hirsuta TaxID=260670 RepID=A0AA40DIE1_9PEZI|nr:hypothetical protein B0H67DRAFT_499583 [Lasiosphaeris hirsuta]